MLLDANLAGEVLSDLSTPLVIVGAGTVGLFLAAALAETRHLPDIIVLDAGPKIPSISLNATTSTSIGKTHGGVLYGRAAGLGGTSSLWGGQLAEFDAADLERHDAAWPLSFQELQKYYQVVYERLRLGRPESADSYRRRFGGEFEQQGAVERFFTYWLEQPNFATVYKRLIRHEPTVRVIVNLTANRIDFDGENARAISCWSASGREVRIRAQRFVFASGTVATARFFLSTQRLGNVPWVANANTGLYFQDHLGGKIAKVSILNENRFRDYFENGWSGGIKLQPKLTLSRNRRESLPSGACGEFTYDSSVSENLANLKRTVRGFRSVLAFSALKSRVADTLAVGRLMLPIVARYVRSRRMFALFDQGLHYNVQAEQIPIANSRIRLLDDGAADGLHRVAVDWRYDGREIDAIYELAVESAAYLKQRGIAELSIDPQLARRESAFIDALRDTYHQCGGTRMSVTPASGVVDGNCRVWGTNNVWVAGAAVLPSSSHANCTLTALALAARLVPCLQ
jgi:choline dehydrogenase-like flavoprotein